MARRSFLVLMAATVTAASCQGSSTDAEEHNSHRILVENYGGCAQVAVELSGRPRSLVLDHACHGWSVEQCGKQLFFLGRGVRIDTGTVVYLDGGRANVASHIDLALRQDGDEHLHLRFLEPLCTADGFNLPFAGSRIGRGEQGSAAQLDGTVTVVENGTTRVSIED